MASSFYPTGSYSNLTRLQLEQLRKADFYAAGKALTVGDSDNATDTSPYSPVGIGDVNAEAFYTNPSILLTDVYSLTPPAQPGPGLNAVTQIAPTQSETVTWYGPTQLISSVGYGLSATQWQGILTNFVTVGVLPGDLLLVTPYFNNPAGDLNSNLVATVVSITTTTKTNDTLNLSNIVNPNYSSSPANTEVDFGFGTENGFVVIRPSAVRLFAYPGSGPTTGQEQTFLAVNPSTTIHSLLGPTTAQVNAARVTNIVPPNYNAVGNDQADAVYGLASPRVGLSGLGYRWIVYPDLGLGLSGAAASISSFTSPTATITGLAGLTSAVVGKYLTLVDATTTANNGTFFITSFISSSSVGILNPNAVAGDASDGHIVWSVIGPNLAAPISATTPINSVVPGTDDRFTFDYKAGIFRLSAAPNAGVINKSVDPASGRLNLWSVFWAVDTSLTGGSATSLYGLLSSNTLGPETAGKIYFNPGGNTWEVIGLLTTNDLLNAMAGLTVYGGASISGGLTVPTGTLTVTNGGANITGGMTIPTGGLNVEAGGANITGGVTVANEVTINYDPSNPSTTALIETPSPIPFGPQNGDNILIWEFTNSGAVGVRMYAANLNNYSQLLITNNANWNGTAWNADDPGINSSVFTLSRNGVSFASHNGASPFTVFETTPFSAGAGSNQGFSGNVTALQYELAAVTSVGTPQVLNLSIAHSLWIDTPTGSGTFTVSVTNTSTGTSSAGKWFQDFWIRIRQTTYNYTTISVTCDNGTVVHFEPGTLDSTLSDTGTDLYHGVIMNGICYMSVQRFPGV